MASIVFITAMLLIFLYCWTQARRFRRDRDSRDERQPLAWRHGTPERQQAVNEMMDRMKREQEGRNDG